ncbi:Acid beta-fructofuranosidase [Sesamum alatum]|uniref:beta-fructofuranosidase n=1 Tax=Sesamum alatum TaxID=300844 RepID=A0AAE1Y8C2_9LAMI|nr:Acid beta-fructofuranosidase [Sesamum alatum]
MPFPNPFPAHSDDAPVPSYAPLLGSAPDAAQQIRRRRIFVVVLLLLMGLVGVCSLVILITANDGGEDSPSGEDDDRCPSPKEVSEYLKARRSKEEPTLRGVHEGVSEKSFGKGRLGTTPYPWTKKMLAWQRTAYHFQPEKNWMNGPLFYKGWYHFFYQYNPWGAVWGNISWGHAVSKDLIHWRHLPLAMVPDKWYDINGVWTGSATILQDGQLIMLYTGSDNASVQVQNLAYPADLSDPLLINWVKYSGNPILVPPPGIMAHDFRDPTTAWLTSEGKWRIIIGSKINKTGISLVYDTTDFKTYEMLEGVLHAVPDTGMWECVDFYPVSEIETDGIDTPVNGSRVKYVVKTSLDDDRNDYYALGTYDSEAAIWTPDDPSIDVGIGLRYDYGIFYASKTFYDKKLRRRVLWSWIKETDSEKSDIRKGWASLQAIPRTIVFDTKTSSNLLLWPVKEVERLRQNKIIFDKVEVDAGSVVPLDVGSTSQLDIVAEFKVDKEALERINGTDMTYTCTKSGGAAKRGALGPFGLLVLASKHLIEQTPIYFYISKDTQGNFTTFFCADHSRSSQANDVDKEMYGSTVPVLKDESLSMRILVDHSIVESFAQGGRTCITSRVYPTRVACEDVKIFLFNNASDAGITASLQVWQMSSAST